MTTGTGAKKKRRKSQKNKIKKCLKMYKHLTVAVKTEVNVQRTPCDNGGVCHRYYVLRHGVPGRGTNGRR